MVTGCGKGGVAGNMKNHPPDISAMSRGVTSGIFLNTSRRTYISTRAFNADFYSYAVIEVALNYTGVVGPVVGATSSNCPQNRILRENGKKLMPGVNDGISTFMVGVYDAETYLNGYIDPNSPAFTPVNTDKPNFIANGINPNGGLTDQAPPVYTRGNVDLSGSIYANGNLDISGNAMIYGNTYMCGNEYIKGNVDIRGSLYVSSSVIFNSSLIVSSCVNINGLVNISSSVTLHDGSDLILEDGKISAKKQILCPTVIDLSGGEALVWSTFVINASLGQLFTLTTNIPGGTSNHDINANNVETGAAVTLIVNGGADINGSSNNPIVFGTNIRENATLYVAHDTTHVISFIGMSNTLYETGRTSVLSS